MNKNNENVAIVKRFFSQSQCKTWNADLNKFGVRVDTKTVTNTLLKPLT